MYFLVHTCEYFPFLHARAVPGIPEWSLNMISLLFGQQSFFPLPLSSSNYISSAFPNNFFTHIAFVRYCT